MNPVTKQEDWSGGIEVVGPTEPVFKECEGVNCLDNFEVTFHKQRRCPRCRREKRSYKDPTAPF